MNQFIATKQEGFDNAIEYFKKDIATLRTGRANPAILDNVMVEAYGTRSPLNSLGNVSVADSSSMTVTAWDKSIMKDIEKAIVVADLGVSVVNDGEKIRLSVPSLTEENRKELVKKLNVKMEDARIEVRKAREEVKLSIEKSFADKEISEDDKFRFMKELDELVVKQNDLIKEIKDKKEKDIMTV